MIMSDEHSYQVMGCAGHPQVQTPNLDRLASEGTLFANCYTPSPICTPARASFYTGQYAHRLGTWDNAIPYDGSVPGIAHYLSRHGKQLTTFGKLDFHPDGVYDGLEAHLPGQRNHPQYESFFRGQDIPINSAARFKRMGVSDRIPPDDRVQDAAVEWLRSKKDSDEPWIMYTGFLDPHFPFFTDEARWNRYEEMVKEIPAIAQPPFPELNEPLRMLRRHFRGDEADAQTVRNAHIGYYAMTSRLDDRVGLLLDTLRECGMEEDTLVIYTSDHGEQLGHHGLWWKCCMYEESVHVPLLMRGPGIRQGALVKEPVSLIDLLPTVCDAAGVPCPAQLPGRSLLPLAKGIGDEYRADFAFSEYHAHGMPSGMYMIRWDRWKYVYYCGFEPQLFDLVNDPSECANLLDDRETRETAAVREALIQCERRLLTVCDPDAVSNRALREQAEIRVELGIEAFPVVHTREVPRPRRPLV
jgi:choline-sulfatase